MNSLGKSLLTLALFLALAGLLLLVIARLALPTLGSLFGDPLYQEQLLGVFLPLASCALLPLTLSLAFRLFSHSHR